jgi:hypothetical protein
MNTTLKSMLIAAAALSAVSSFAQDKATLDLLVKKGLITAEERAKTLDESSQARAASGVGRVFPKEDATKRLTISGYFQAAYQSFNYKQDGLATDMPNQSQFLMRRLYVEILADIGEGISGNIVLDTSGNTTSSSTSWLDRAIVSHSSNLGTFDVGYKKVTWGYEESTLSSLFKASSSKLYTVERGITNRYWNEGENGNANRSDGRRLGFGAHHLGIHYTSVVNPQGFEYGASVVNSAQGRFTEGNGSNDLGYYANVVWNNKVSDNEKYAVGINYGKTKYFASTATTTYAIDAGVDTLPEVPGGKVTATTNTPASTLADMEGYNPFVQVQYFNWTVYGEYLSTKVTSSRDALVNSDDQDHKPTGYNATVAYKINDNWEGVARYTSLDTDNRGVKISDGERGFSTKSNVASPAATGNSDAAWNKSDAIYLGLNYYFTIPVAGAAAVNGPNAKIQFGLERANFNGKISVNSGVASHNSDKAHVDALRVQAQVAF